MLNIAALNQDRGISPQRSKGAAVHLLAMREAFEELGSTVVALDFPDDKALNSALASHHQHRPFDLLYERYALGKSTGARFAHTMGIPLVLEVNAPLADEQQMYRGSSETSADREADEFAFQHAQCVIAVSEAVAKYACGRGAREDALMVCPNGIDTRRFNLQVDGAAVRGKYVPDGAFVLGFHGRQRPWHGFEHLVAACHSLLNREIPVHLLVVGEGEFSELATLPAHCHTRIGWQPHDAMPAFVAAFDALPLTYQPDVPCYFSPLKLMEAMACGVIPVVPGMGDLASVVEHGKTGLVYEPGNSNALVESLAGMAADPKLRKTMGRLAASKASEHSWKGIASAILQRVIEPRSRSIQGSH